MMNNCFLNGDGEHWSSYGWEAGEAEDIGEKEGEKEGGRGEWERRRGQGGSTGWHEEEVGKVVTTVIFTFRSKQTHLTLSRMAGRSAAWNPVNTDKSEKVREERAKPRRVANCRKEDRN